MATAIDEARLEEYRSQYQKDPNSLVFAVLAEACRQRGLLEEAELVCANGLRIHPAYVTGHLVMGDIMMERTRSREAEREYLEVLRLDPNNPIARISLARIYVDRHDIDRAIEQLDLVLFLYPGNENARKLMETSLRLKEQQGEQPAAAPEVAPQPAAPQAPPVTGPAAAPGSPAPAAEHLPPLIPAPPEEGLLTDDEISPDRALFIAQKDEELLGTLSHVAGVKAAMLVGRDGLVVASGGGADILDEVTAALLSNVHVSSETYTERMDLGLLREITVDADEGMLRVVRVATKVLIVLLASDARLGMVNLHIANTASRVLQLYRRH